MFDLIADQPLRFIVALLVGLATAWWTWARREAVVADADVDAGHAPAAAAPQAVAAPVAAAAEPVAAEPVAPLAAAAPVAAAPVAAGGPRIAAAVGADDDLLLIKGIGPKLNALCHSLGIRRFDQIAAWTAADVAEVDGYLQNFRGRIEREEWVEQAKLLAAGKMDEFAARFG